MAQLVKCAKSPGQSAPQKRTLAAELQRWRCRWASGPAWSCRCCCCRSSPALSLELGQSILTNAHAVLLYRDDIRPELLRHDSGLLVICGCLVGSSGEGNSAVNSTFPQSEEHRQTCFPGIYANKLPIFKSSAAIKSCVRSHQLEHSACQIGWYKKLPQVWWLFSVKLGAGNLHQQGSVAKVLIT